MRLLPRRVVGSPFVKDLAIVMSGTAAAQAIVLASSPILTRIYGAEAYGILGVFTALTVPLANISTGGYDTAIMLPKDRIQALNIFFLSVVIAALAGLFTAVFFWIGKRYVNFFDVPALGPYLLLASFVVVMTGWVQALTHWVGRDKRFSLMSRARFRSSVGSTGWNLCAGVAGLGAGGLILGTLFFPLIQATVLICASGRQLLVDARTGLSARMIRQLAVRYRAMPAFRAPDHFLLSVAQNAPTLVLASFFGPAQAGLFLVARRAIWIPGNLASDSMQKVFYQKAVQIHNESRRLFKPLLQATLALTAVAAPPFLLIAVYGPTIFGTVFGKEWETAGQYAQWLAVWLFAGFINTPSKVVVPILNLEKTFFVRTLVSTSAKIGLLFIGAYALNSALAAIMLYSLAGAMSNLISTVYVIRYCARRPMNE